MSRWVLALAIFALAGAARAADEDKDLELIPGQPGRPEKANAPESGSVFGGEGRLFVENALTSTAVRNDLLVPVPPPLPPSWEERFLGDVRIAWPLASNAHIAYSGRLSFVAQEGLGFPNRGNVTNDLREIYASVEPQPRSYLDAGRINVKSGVALGFNPTDFFKTRAVVDPLTTDPSVLREDRLGTLMLRGQHVGEASSVIVAYAPRVTHPSPVAVDPYRGFNPLWGRTNGTQRGLVKVSAQLGEGVNPELLAYWENGMWQLGANIAESVGQSTVVYLELSGGRQLGIADQALAFARATGTIPSDAPSAFTQGNQERFRSQVAVGASYTTESKITFNLEYHYNGAGFSRSDWDRWFAAGEGRSDSSPIVRGLWYIRQYAAGQQEPMQRNSAFFRADWMDAFVPKLELTAFALVDAGDGSTRWQVEADYAKTDLWNFGVLAAGSTGGRHSNYGSLPSEASVLLKMTRYF